MQEPEVPLFTAPLDRLGLTYMITGSVAGSLHGEPRMTHDVDIVLLLPESAVAPLLAAFPSTEFYAPPEEVVRVELARERHGHFNLIHHHSGFKADIYLVGEDPLHHWALQRRQQMSIGGGPVWVAPVEYVILRKLQFYAEGGSEKHLRDIRGMLAMTGTLAQSKDIQEWAERLRVSDAWQRARSGAAP